MMMLSSRVLDRTNMTGVSPVNAARAAICSVYSGALAVDRPGGLAGAALGAVVMEFLKR